MVSDLYFCSSCKGAVCPLAVTGTKGPLPSAAFRRHPAARQGSVFFLVFDRRSSRCLERAVQIQFEVRAGEARAAAKALREGEAVPVPEPAVVDRSFKYT
eukprot:1194252-Prorocentrum_minimum.AAC.2